MRLLTLLFFVSSINSFAQNYDLDVKVHSLTDTLDGSVGEIERDIMGNLFVADFGEKIWKISRHGDVEIFSDRMYGSSGNAMDSQGNIYQAQYYGNTIVKINRYTGEVTEVANKGLVGPVGLAFNGDELYVCNCNNNTVARIYENGDVKTIGSGELFNCPNGIEVGSDGNLYVVNYRNPNVVRIRNGEVSLFTKLPASSGGHIIEHKGNFYITSFFDHKLFKVSLDGAVTHFAGTGKKGIKNGNGPEAEFSNPNGIVAANGKLYLNDKITYSDGRPNQSVIREIIFKDFSSLIGSALNKGGLPAAIKAYDAYKVHPLYKNDNTETELNQFAYRMLSQKEIEIAIGLFTLNSKSYPDSFNVWDSLAEAYMVADDNASAIKYYKKSLALNPDNANAAAMLEKLK